MSDNKYSEMLTYFLDGELDPSSEPELFSQLGENRELQNEMNEILAIRKSVQSDNCVFTPPVESTVAIFSAIGFSLPEADKPVVFNKKSVTARYYKALIPIILASLLTYLLISSYYGDRINSLQQQISDINGNILKSGNIESNSITSIEKSLDNISSMRSFPIVTSGETIEKASYSGRQYSKKLPAPDEKIEIAENNEVGKFIAAKRVEKINNGLITGIGEESLNAIRTPDLRHGGFNGIARRDLLLNENNSNVSFSAYFRGITRGALPGTTLPPNAEPLFSYMSIGIYRSFKSLVSNNSIIEDIKLGIDFGQEPYRQEFYENKTNQTTGIIVQNPMLFWCSASCRIDYKSPSFLYGIKPYSQFAFGGTQMGPLAKAQAGLQYELNDVLGVNFGIEGTSLFYYNKPEWYSSEKVSLIYGMSIKF